MKRTPFDFCLVFNFLITALPLLGGEVVEFDVCVYGGTCSGIVAAIQAHRMGKTAVIAEFSSQLGGLTTGGLGATDIGNKAAIGGISREFYTRLGKYYGTNEAWKFEPHAATKVYHEMIREAGVPVYFQQRLATVKKEGARLVEITMENGRIFRARMFIDASYEGDLMAKAGVSYHVGREANAQYSETLNGVRAETPKHQFLVLVDPYVKPGDPASGLLPFIQPGDGGRPGAGDRCVQTYNFRLCLTQNPENKMSWEKPAPYDEKKYELLARLLEAHVAAGKPLRVGQLMNPVMVPNGKADVNNNGAFSSDFIGANYDYPEGDYATRERIWKEHEIYHRGFLYFLATSSRVPAALRAEMNSWGLAKDEFLDTGGWPHQLYVREARRMISDYVMTENHCRGTLKAGDAVGLGAYNMDSHNCQRLVKNGHVENEGDVQVGVSPYPVSYRSIVPKAGECENLFVPVCLAASHIAYGSIRMEPVFMILGQSAATAASLALDAKVSAQKLPYDQLKARLLADKQVLEWTGPVRKTADPAKAALKNIKARSLPGIVLDDRDAEIVGEWSRSSAARSLEDGYLHDGNANKGKARVAWRPKIPAAGEYEIFLLYPPLANRASNVPVTIAVQGGASKTVKVNEKAATKDNATSLGRFKLPAGKLTTVTIFNEGTDGYVVADGVQLVRVGGN